MPTYINSFSLASAIGINTDNLLVDPGLTVVGGISASGKITTQGDLAVYGNLYTYGGSTQISSTNLTVGDPIIYFANNNTDPNDPWDIGIVGHFYDSSNTPRYQHTGLIRNHSDNTWSLFSGLTTEPGITVNFNDPYFKLDDLNVHSIKAGTGGNSIPANIQINGNFPNTSILKSASFSLFAVASSGKSPIAVWASNETGGDPTFRSYSSRGTYDTPLALSANDTIAAFRGFGYNGSDFNHYGNGGGASMNYIATTDQTPTAGGTRIDFLTCPASSARSDSPITRMTINDDGNVGINTITPKAQLDVNGSIITRADNYNGTGLFGIPTANLSAIASVSAILLSGVYIEFPAEGISGQTDTCLLRQIGGSDSYILSFDMYDNMNSSAGQGFAIRTIPTANYTTNFALSNIQTNFWVDPTGAVGIGTKDINPSSALTVNGDVSFIDGLIFNNGIINDAGHVIGVNITYSSYDRYITSASVQFVGGGGTGATGTVQFTQNYVTGVTITNPGTGYITPPAAVFNVVYTGTVMPQGPYVNNTVSTVIISPKTATLCLSGQRVGIGTTTPNNALTVVGNISASGSVYGDLGFTNSFSTNGYQKLPSGLILQWGYVGGGAVKQNQTNFPIAFPTACVGVHFSPIQVGATNVQLYNAALTAPNDTTTNCLTNSWFKWQITGTGAAAMYWYWYAIGY
jgi:hypothetical protein